VSRGRSEVPESFLRMRFFLLMRGSTVDMAAFSSFRRR
jgi:hypothetical protein